MQRVEAVLMRLGVEFPAATLVDLVSKEGGNGFEVVALESD
jgi:hypothetical protein